MDLLNPKLLLGAEGKGEVGKGGQEDPSTAVSSAVALGGGTCFLSGEDAWQTPQVHIAASVVYGVVSGEG